jgi:superfamily II DNA helicase RecQ
VLGAVCFHRTVGTTEDKLELLRLLTDGQQQVLVATSAMRIGIDCSSIRYVCSVVQIQQLQDLVQLLGARWPRRSP